MTVIQKYYMNKVIEFERELVEFCRDKQIDHSFKAALDYKFCNGIPGPFIYKLFTAPKLYLSRSKSFNEWRRKLDYDFQRDLITEDTLSGLRIIEVKDRYLKRWLQERLKSDYKEGA